MYDPFVTMVTANFGWAVAWVPYGGYEPGSKVALYHDGIWTDTDFPATLNAFAAVGFTSPTDGWANDSSGFLHYTNGHWLEYYGFPADDAIITSIGMSSSSAGWAIGSGYGGQLLFRYDGVSWRQVAVPASEPHQAGVLALSVISPTEFWAVEGSLVPPGSQYTSGANVAT
jgi:hypothetical protein